MAYRFPKKVSRPRPSAVLVAILAAAAVVIIGLFAWYSLNLRPASNSQTAELFTVDQGASARQIATGLQSLGLIRSSTAFVLYTEIHHFKNKLQAGTYKFRPAMSSQEIAQSIANGYIDRNWVTILPGKRLDQIRQIFVNVGYSQNEVIAAFNISNYSDLPLVANLPAGATLEGLLYPDSFERTSATPAQTIVRESLQEMQDQLTPSILSGFAAQGLSEYQGITLASIVYKESGSPTYDPTIAQVFLSRLKQNMALGSDVTAIYGALKDGVNLPDNVDQAGVIAVEHDSPYNTRLHSGLPPGPISNMTDDALKAVAAPANTNYLFFVSGADCTIHFAQTENQHEQNIQKYGAKACS